ncbi:MAG: phosphatase [Proteobacteria bacterium]|nr:MAG: phosphatase [Pseudomonadota bacterium]PIE67868.1 MAG: phosphatase [Deltaproteobacteria bacterium]
MASDIHAGIDLHVHSTASDGTLSPSDILTRAVELGLSAISITDHDTLDGAKTALTVGIPPVLQFTTGIEISAAAPDGYHLGSVHILGYGIDPNDKPLNELLQHLIHARQQRNPQIIDQLNAMGMDVNMADLADVAGNGTAGRPHIARLLVQRGMATSINDAFDRFLGKNKPAYVDKYRAPMQTAIEAIDHAGGVAVLAHPILNGITDPAAFERFLVTLKSLGLKGIEAIYPDHSEAVTAEYLRLARKHRLLITGGSDFHGDVTPGIQMGTGNGDMHVPFSLFEALTEYLDTKQ